MSLKVHILDTPAKLRAASQEWDALWSRSSASLPNLRAETAAHWSEYFTGGRLAAVCVEDSGCFVAALALVPSRFKRMVPALGPASGVWSRCGELLVDAETDLHAACDLLVRAILGFRRPLVWCDAVPYMRPEWQAFQQAAARQGCMTLCIEQPAVGQISLQHDWAEYLASRSRSHRRSLRRAEQHAARAGGIDLAWYEEPSPDLAAALVRQVFEIEHRGWKGGCGGSVLSVPGLVQYFERQARQLAEWRQVRFAFLLLKGRPIAFEYAPCAKGVYHTVKVGYDEAWRELAPGHLLRLRAYRELFAIRSMQCIDFSGPLTQATARWSTHVEPRGCLLLAANLAGCSTLAVYRALRPLVQRLRCRPPTEFVSQVRPVAPHLAAPRG